MQLLLQRHSSQVQPYDKHNTKWRHKEICEEVVSEHLALMLAIQMLPVL